MTIDKIKTDVVLEMEVLGKICKFGFCDGTGWIIEDWLNAEGNAFVESKSRCDCKLIVIDDYDDQL